ncbi:hypothetical protein KBTX_00724 [wastewater metagenome]|uniref:ABM domain-containing protein n=2 Tax=unclassified sequences TaxID=12908 RepID=A0A5B8R6U7_9ZZZZ|nr:antibiotic biosynthesis monooxygenase [Arhodomonas sp. KWT]QEA04416.1 hypothetical protein KBTEX_00724 [uncultured organism]
MSVTRINRFTSEEGMAADLHEGLRAIVPLVEASGGCLSSRLMRNTDFAREFGIQEERASVEAHRASLERVPPETVAIVMPPLAGGHVPNR